MSLFACCTSRDKTKEEPEIDPVKKPHLLAAAAASGSQRLVEKALEAGYAIDQPDEQGSTPLTAAAWGGFPDLVRFFISKGANVNAPNFTHNWTPLFAAAYKGHLECVKILIEEGKADFKRRDKHNATAEDYAKQKQHHEIADYLRNVRRASAASGDRGALSSRPSSAPSRPDESEEKLQSRLLVQAQSADGGEMRPASAQKEKKRSRSSSRKDAPATATATSDPSAGTSSLA